MPTESSERPPTNAKSPAKDVKFSAVLVEDEQPSRERLRRLLGRHEQVEIVGETDVGTEAIELTNRLRPDILFLDISLPGCDGFEVVSQIPSQTRVIFTTAREEHAVRAFRTNATDYLLKPIDPQQLEVAIARAAEALSNRGDIVRLLCRDRDRTHVINTEDILFLRAEDGYTHVQTQNSYYLTGEPLALFEKQLASSFVRVHRNTLVNVKHVRQLKHNDAELTVVLASDHEIPVSRRHSQEFRRRLAYHL